MAVNVLESSPARSEFDDCREAIAEFLSTESEQARLGARRLAREMTEQRVSIRQALECYWECAQSALDETPASARDRVLGSIAVVHRDLGDELDRWLQQELRSHSQLASAYCQKNREVNTLLDSLPAFAFLKDAEFRYTAVNKIFADALGMPASSVVSRTDFDLFPRDIASRFVKRDREVMASCRPVRHEETIDFQGESRTVLVIKAPVVGNDGCSTGLIGVGFDITERKRMEEEHTLLAAALESAGEAIFITDTEGRIHFVNPAFEKVSGYSRDEAIGQNPRILKSGAHPPDFYRRMWGKLTQGEVWQGSLRNKKKDGTFFDIEQTIAPIHDAAGRTTNYIAVTRDVTERKRMLEALQRAVMVKSEFTSMVSHELRTPLTAIKEAIGVVGDGTAGEVNKHQADFLALAKRNVDRLHRLINDTLDFSKLERGEFNIEFGSHDLNALVSETVAQQRLAAEKQGLGLEVALDSELPLVRMDADRISQVLINLIGNSIRYGVSGWIEVATKLSNDEVVVRVQDTGPGIPEKKLDNIFDAFVQLSTGPGRRSGGTGLGLAICKKIVELHGGRIWVESEVDKGSAFSFSLRLGKDSDFDSGEATGR